MSLRGSLLRWSLGVAWSRLVRCGLWRSLLRWSLLSRRRSIALTLLRRLRSLLSTVAWSLLRRWALLRGLAWSRLRLSRLGARRIAWACLGCGRIPTLALALWSWLLLRCFP